MTTYVDRTAGAVEYCESMKASHPTLSETYTNLAQALQAKLWHQLTVQLLDFLESSTIEQPLGLYEAVIQKVKAKLAPLAVARMACRVAFLVAPSEDVAASKALLENGLEAETVTAARVFLQAKYILLSLEHLVDDPAIRKESLAAMATRIKEQKTQLSEASHGLSSSDQALVAAAHYESVMAYHKVVGPAEAFYEAALLFLQYAPVPVVGSAASSGGTDYAGLAMDWVLAALTGDGVYNLGQVLQETALLALLPPEQVWVKELLEATAAGQVSVFQQLTAQYATQIAEQPALVHRATAVQEKLTLLALVSLVVSKEAHVRPHLQFAEIAQHLQVSIDQVEWVVMRAISVHLLEATLDQVLQQVQVTWVLPRTLTQTEMADYASRYATWASKTSQMAEYMAQEIPASFA